MSEALALTRLRRPEAAAGATLGRLDRVHIPFPATVSAFPGCQSKSGAERDFAAPCIGGAYASPTEQERDLPFDGIGQAFLHGGDWKGVS